MKKKEFLFMGLFLFSWSIHSQDLPVSETTGKITYADTINIENMAHQTLGSRIMGWYNFFAEIKEFQDPIINTSDDSSNYVLYIQDEIHFTFIGLKWTSIMRFQLKLYSVDNQYSYVLTDIVYFNPVNENDGVYEFEYNNYDYVTVDAEFIFITDFYNKKGKPKAINDKMKEATVIKVEEIAESLKQFITSGS